MNVYLLIEETDQGEFTYKGEAAEPISSVVGIYADRDRAEHEKEKMSQESAVNSKQYNTDPCTYFIEERPVL